MISEMSAITPIRLALAAMLLVLLFVGGFALWGLFDFDLSDQKISTHRFSYGSDSISATLVLPQGCSHPAVAIIIHGDGAQNRWSDDTYLPLINSLLDNCIGVYSWDKPGVGQSTGNWLLYSMEARAELASEALLQLQSLPELANNRIGFLGFSQAGWVVPAASTHHLPAFSVLIGAAVNWKAQGAYLTRTRLALEGLKPRDAELIAEQIQRQDEALYTLNQLRDAQVPDGMQPDRFEFIRIYQCWQYASCIFCCGGGKLLAPLFCL